MNILKRIFIIVFRLCYRTFIQTTYRVEKEQRKALAKILERNCNTEYGQKYRFLEIKDNAELYRQTVPIHPGWEWKLGAAEGIPLRPRAALEIGSTARVHLLVRPFLPTVLRGPVFSAVSLPQGGKGEESRFGGDSKP